VRFRHPDGSTVHLAYCTNVHPAEDLDGVVDQLGRFAGPVRTGLGASRLGVGLWLSAPVAARLAASPADVKRLRAALDQHRLEVVTFNGFPYRGFHEPVVKHAVYRPDWSEPERADYTLDLARILAALLPDDVTEGSISTLPLGWKDPGGAPDGWQQDCREQLARVVDGLTAVEAETGRTIRLAFEPEPGCLLDELRTAAGILMAFAPGQPPATPGIAQPVYVNDWLGLCLDACHLAVGFEDPYQALHDVTVRGRVGVVKAQISAALRAYAPHRERDRLARCVEPRFLHQTRQRTLPGMVSYCDDLEQALAGSLSGQGEWRIHFHVPVHHAVGTTQAELVTFLGHLVGGPTPLTRHLEVETYTWSVLPDRPAGDAGLVAGLAAELAWTRDRLTALGLKELL
jgi:sugar phosphate isomerase/epimerase